jgi:hypothetical protein
MSKTQKTVDGFHCLCGEYHKFTAYVFAHWDESLTFACPKCKREWSIIRGVARLMRKKKSEAGSRDVFEEESSGRSGGDYLRGDLSPATPSKGTE